MAPAYSFNTSYGNCTLYDGGLSIRYRCYKDYHTSVLSVEKKVESCEEYCTNKESCLGYIFLNDRCHLYGREMTCPIGFRYYAGSKPPTSTRTVESKEDQEWVCKGKHSSMRICSLDNI